MLIPVLLFAALAMSGGASSPHIDEGKVYEGSLPLTIYRREGGLPTMGPNRVVAGDFSDKTAPFGFVISFNGQGEDLGEPRTVGWWTRLGDYCRNRPSWVQSVLTGPEGQVWRGDRTPVPAGPDRRIDYANGPAGPIGPGHAYDARLLEALAAGGRFTLRLEDDEGQVLHAEVIDTLTPARRQALFAANLAEFRKADPDMPVSGTVPILPGEPVPTPPVRPCPVRGDPAG